MTSDDVGKKHTRDLEREATNLRIGLRDWAQQIDHTLEDIERWLRTQRREPRHRPDAR